MRRWPAWAVVALVALAICCLAVGAAHFGALGGGEPAPTATPVVAHETVVAVPPVVPPSSQPLPSVTGGFVGGGTPAMPTAHP